MLFCEIGLESSQRCNLFRPAGRRAQVNRESQWRQQVLILRVEPLDGRINGLEAPGRKPQSANICRAPWRARRALSDLFCLGRSSSKI